MSNDEKKLQIPKQLGNDIRKFFMFLAIESRTKAKQPYKYISEARMSSTDSVAYMNEEQYTKYQGFITKLHALYPHSKNYDRRYAESKFREAMFQATKFSGDPNVNAKDAFKITIEAFQHTLCDWRVYIPVSGLALYKKTSWSFGKVFFCSKANRTFKLDAGELFMSSDNVTIHTVSRYYARLDVEAVDVSAATNLAIQEVEKHVNVLNALGRLYGAIKPKDPHNMYGDKGVVINDWTIHCTITPRTSGLRLGRSVALGGFNPTMLKAPFLRTHYKWRWISKQLKNPTSTLFEERILPALKWIGKSALRTSNEEIFLDYSLAVEAMYFETKHSGELTKELQLRIYKLLFTNTSYLSSAIESYNKFEYIYDLRSRIVHRGGVEVSENDIQLMYDLARASLQKIIYYPRFRQRTSKRFESWLMSGRKK